MEWRFSPMIPAGTEVRTTGKHGELGIVWEQRGTGSRNSGNQTVVHPQITQRGVAETKLYYIHRLHRLHR